MLTLYIGSDNVLEVGPLTNAVDLSSVVDAVVQATLYDRSGNAISGVDPLTIPHASEGTYREIIPDDIPVTIHRHYYAIVVADSPTVGKKKWREEVEVVYAGAKS